MLNQDSPPARHRDGTLTATIDAVDALLPGGASLRVHVPNGALTGPTAGRYVLARCGVFDGGVLDEQSERVQQWPFPLRRPLWLTEVRRGANEATHETWSLLLPESDHAADAWLRRRTRGEQINLIGPLGNGFSLRAGSRNLLLLADGAARPKGIAPLLALVDERLDDGGRVTLVVKNPSPALSLQGRELSSGDSVLAGGNKIDIGAWLRERLPLAVELHLATAREWDERVMASLAWADQVCAALPMDDYRGLGDAIKAKRFFLEEGFAQGLVEADLACGVGACLACVVPLGRGGWTRACVHGPVLDLATLVG